MSVNPETVQLAILVGGPLLTAGAAWGAAKSALNGTRETCRRIETKVDRNHEDSQQRFDRVEGDLRDTRERVVRVEAQIE